MSEIILSAVPVGGNPVVASHVGGSGVVVQPVDISVVNVPGKLPVVAEIVGSSPVTYANTGINGGSQVWEEEEEESPAWQTKVKGFLQGFMPTVNTNVAFDYKRILLMAVGITVCVAIVIKFTSKRR